MFNFHGRYIETEANNNNDWDQISHLNRTQQQPYFLVIYLTN